ncbi:Na(+)-translocating NADH-quinone reductase subunit F [Tenacibaculum holothuriorum]|uniref:Na(+)-translocating NADH-quinone reductase subunit F n=1 Tax=Tenacibaculum holothuriorum TaxID=1635173 RepID=A0A1Y2PEZ6_9FLAO|nr:Na(+)-translocating NADH-quinone reductase subunit F [Tenacibaculum holothuriorum]OSY89063.1 Na(+)-translocating NADH-quinone reductase subunit F [Tenacibaculum holothuriorum]
MEIPKRLENALIKLYNAFHNDELNPECCSACAVGNILDNHDSWKHLSDKHGSLELSYVGRVHQNLGRKFNGYTPLELLKIEKTFLDACGFKTPLCHYNMKPDNSTDKEMLFNALSEVVALLCSFENIANVMDYSKIFEYEENSPVYKFDAIF